MLKTTTSTISMQHLNDKVNILNEDLSNIYQNTLSDEEIYQDFLDMVKNDEEIKITYRTRYEELQKEKELGDIAERKAIRKNLEKYQKTLGKELFNLVPNIHIKYVAKIIETQFNNNFESYKSTIPLFFNHFSKANKLICDNGASGRKEKKKRKHLILHSAQLLKLVGYRRCSIITNDCVSYYKEEMEKADEFLENFRLVNHTGNISKLMSNETKQKQKVAQILTISECMAKMAKDNDHTFMMLTLTLPPAYNCNPIRGKYSYQGYTPQDALNTIHRYWKAIRARLHNYGIFAGEHYTGLSVCELMQSSTLHNHILIYSSKEDQKEIMDHIEKIRVLENSKYADEETDTPEKKAFNKSHRIGAKNWDIRLKDENKVTNDDLSGAYYLFKYIMKTHTDYKDEQVDDSALKNIVARYFYQCRGFNFFGLKGSISIYNFLQRNFERYIDVLPMEITDMLIENDYYTFVTSYKKYFKNVRENGKLLGVQFDKSMFDESKNFIPKSILNQEVVFIDKIQYCVFEKQYQEDMKNINEMPPAEIEYANAFMSFEQVKSNQFEFDLKIKSYLFENNLKLAVRDEEMIKRYKILKPHRVKFNKYFDYLNSSYAILNNLYSYSNPFQEKSGSDEPPNYANSYDEEFL